MPIAPWQSAGSHSSDSRISAVGERELQPRHARPCEHDGIGLAARELQKPGFDIAAQGNDFEIGAKPERLRLSA